MTTNFSAAEQDPLAGSRYHVIICERTMEAAAFVAALSRWIDSSPGFTPGRSGGPAEIWGTTSHDDGVVTLFLNNAALRAAESAFSALPVVGTCSSDVVPRAARLVLNGSSQSMGLIEAQQEFSEAGQRLSASP